MVVLSYLLAIALAFACISLPYVFFGLLPIGSQGNLIVYRLMLSIFGLVAGFTILWSLLPPKNERKINGVRIDLTREKRLAKEIEAIAGALREPMPSEVYLIGDANAFVCELDSEKAFDRRRILGLGLPLLQMLTIAQFRAVLAHEFAHYYSGDTRLGPWVYEARTTLMRLYQNLGKNSETLGQLRRVQIVALAYMLLMGGLRAYWQLFMRVTQAISRRQEMRSDELACYLAGSQPLIEGLQSIERCHAVLNSYWNSLVLPVAMNGYQPKLGEGFMRYMQAPRIEKATTEILAKREADPKTSPMDSHPPLKTRIELAMMYNLPAPSSDGKAKETTLPMISLIDELPALENSLLKKMLPKLAETELKPLEWERAGEEFYIPTWRKQMKDVQPVLSTKTMTGFPGLLMDPRVLYPLMPDPKGNIIDPARINAWATNALYSAFALCLLDHGWTLHSHPGAFYLEQGENRVEPGEVLSSIREGKLVMQGWEQYCKEHGIGDWPLA